MAETTKKYVSLENLQAYHELEATRVAAEDAKILAEAKGYSDSLNTAQTTALESAKTELEGEITAVETALGQESARAEAKEQELAEAIAAINDEETGILKVSKDYTDEKVTALADGAVKNNTAAIAILNSDENTEGSVKKAIADSKADLDADIAELDGRVEDLEETVAKLDGEDTVEGSVKAQIKAAKEALEQAHANDVDAINAKIGDVTTGKTVVTMIEDAVKAEEDARKKAVAGVQDALDTLTQTHTDDKAELAQAIADEASTARAAEQANAEAIAALGNKVGEVEEGKTVVEMISDAVSAIDAHKEAVDEKVATLIGDDTGKSVRKIANEELAAQLLSGNADADFKTLQELALWLENHPESVAEINANIANLQELVGTIPTDATAKDIVGYIAEAVEAEKVRAESEELKLSNRIKSLEDAVGTEEDGSVSEQITAKINELDADVTSAAVEAGKGIQVQVVETDGKITAVNVTGNYDNAYDALGAAAQALTDAKAYVDEKDEAMDSRVETIETAIDKGGSVTTAIANAQSTADSALEKVNAFEPLTTEDIENLFKA